MNQEEFKKLLKESGLPKEFSQKIDQMIRVINDHEERIKFLEISLNNKSS
jgi:hypothetical protein